MTSSNPASPAQPTRLWAAAVVFLAVWIAWTGVIGWIRYQHPGLDHGDQTTDANILNAGENFDREGFWKSWGLPAVDTFRAEGKQPDFYVTYPPGCYWIHQFYKSIGLRQLAHQRLAAIVASSLAVLLFFVLCLRISGSGIAAAAAGIAYMLTRPFAEYADNLHYLAFSQLTLMATLLGWVLFESADTPRARFRWLLFTMIIFALDAMVTFEHTLFVAAFAMVRIVLARRWGLLVSLAMLCAVPALVLAARFLVNAVALGSFEEIWGTMSGKLRQRTGLGGEGVSYAEVGHAMLARLGWPPMRGPSGGIDAEFRIGVLAPAVLAPMGVLALITLSTWHLEGMRSIRKMAGGTLALLLGGATWFLVMREHAHVHRFTTLLLLPGIAAAIGTLVASGWAQWNLHPRGAPVRLAGIVAGCVLLIAHTAQLRHSHLLNIHWRLDSSVHEVNQLRARFDDRFAEARPALAGIKRLYMHSHDASAGRKLGVPFDNDPGKVHAPLAADEVQAIIWISPAARAVAGEAHQLLGPARFLGPPADQYLAIHFPGRTDLGRVSIKGSQGAMLTRLWTERTLDGSAVTVGAEVEAASAGLDTAALALHIRILGPGGKEHGHHWIGYDQRVAMKGFGVAWLNIDAAALKGAEAIELWLVNRATKRRIRFDAAGAVLPDGVRFSDDARSLVLPPPR